MITYPKQDSHLVIDREVERAIRSGKPVVALESTVITHGLPYPQNRELAEDMERDVRDQGALPATISVVRGQIYIGTPPDEIEALASGKNLHKISVRDFAPAIAQGWSGGTTVAGTLFAARAAGIQVFATGGIGGVHRTLGEPLTDISADLPQLAQTPLVLVCAGAKAILDLPATLEYLETWGVPVVGYRTDDFPAFYSLSSGLKASARADSPAQAAAIARAHWDLGMPSAVLVANPPPEEDALPSEQVSGAIETALTEAHAGGIRGQAVTPFLLQRVSELTGGASLKTNLALLRSNARLAAQIAVELAKK